MIKYREGKARAGETRAGETRAGIQLWGNLGLLRAEKNSLCWVTKYIIHLILRTTFRGRR